MSDFDDAMAEALGETLDVFGRVTATIRQTEIEGALNALSLAEQYAMGGMEQKVKQTFVFQLADAPPGAALKSGEPALLAGVRYTIGLVEIDEISVTLYLTSPNS